MSSVVIVLISWWLHDGDCMMVIALGDVISGGYMMVMMFDLVGNRNTGARKK